VKSGKDRLPLIAIILALAGGGVLLGSGLIPIPAEAAARAHTVFNYVEAGVWAAAGIYVLLRSRGRNRALRRLAAAASIAFFAFGASDLVEVRTGTWYEPWWLLVWKAACVVVLLSCLAVHRRLRRCGPRGQSGESSQAATSSASSASLPAAAVAGIAVAILFLGLFALEISHGLFRQDGKLAKSLLAFPPVLLLLCGLLARRRWALFGARALALLGAGWFVFIAGYAAILRPHDRHGAVWIWILCVSLVLGAVLLTGFVGLGRPSTRRHYGLICPRCQRETRGLRPYFSAPVHCRGCGHSW
jgi:hypothetical protein